MLNKKINNKISVLALLFLLVVFFSIFILKEVSNIEYFIQPVTYVEESEVVNIRNNIDDKKLENFVILDVLDQSYQIQIKEGDTVYNAMQSLDDINKSFSFGGKKYIGLGFFVNTINGIKGSSGLYWIYYVNGEEASVGVSKYILKSGDIITWNQE